MKRCKNRYFDRPVFYGAPTSPYGQYILDAVRPEMAGIIDGSSMAYKLLKAAHGYSLEDAYRLNDDIRGMSSILRDYGFLAALEAACYIRY